jgi:putative tryptophan/tyrosine transport system substrate-binding protein
MRRREFLSLLGSFLGSFFGGLPLAAPIKSYAQSSAAMRRVAVLMPYADDPIAEARLDLFRQGLRLRGWIDGSNIKIDYYFANSDLGRMRSYAKTVAAAAPAAIFAASPPVVTALKRETGTIPIVFTNITDPVGVGLVQSLSHPGGNITGFGAYEFSIAGKWVELLKQIAPSTTHIAVVKMPQHSTNAKLFQAAQPTAKSLQIELTEANVRSAKDIDEAVTSAAAIPGGGLLILPSPATTDYHDLIVRLAAQHKLPAMYPYRDLAAGGGLVSYGPNVSEDYKSAAIYIDRILRGERPADLPVRAPAKFELVVNLKTAKALGLSLSPSLLARVDEVIE